MLERYRGEFRLCVVPVELKGEVEEILRGRGALNFPVPPTIIWLSSSPVEVEGEGPGGFLQAWCRREELRSFLNGLFGERERAEGLDSKLTRQLEKAKREWEGTFDAIQEPVMILDSDYRILRANLATSKYSSVDIKRVIRKKCYKILMGRQEPCPNCPLERTFAEGKAQRSEVKSADGERIYQVDSFPLKVEPEAEVWAVNAYRNLTEERRLQEAISKADKLSSLGMLAGRVAHEINNPLTGILGYTQLLMMDFPEDSHHYSLLQKIEEAALRCRKIVQNLLQFSHLNFDHKRELHDINRIIREATELYKLLPPKDGAFLDLELQPDLPLLPIDPDKLYSAIVNLLSNAKMATPPGGIITVSTKKKNGTIVISVRDSGSGIPESIRDKLFQPFFTTKKRGEGTGIGLYTVKKTAQEFGGDAVLHWSEVGKGSEFRIYLPIKELDTGGR